MVDRGTRGKGARGGAAGGGARNPALRESAARSGTCDWPRVAMVAGAASTEVHSISAEVAEHRGGGGGAEVGEGVGLRFMLVVHAHILLCRTKLDTVNGANHSGENPTRCPFGCSTTFCTAPIVTRGEIVNYPMATNASCGPVVSS